MNQDILKRDLYQFADLVGKEWVADQVQKIESEVRRPKKSSEIERKFHPLGQLFHRVLPGLEAKTYDPGSLTKLTETAPT